MVIYPIFYKKFKRGISYLIILAFLSLTPTEDNIQGNYCNYKGLTEEQTEDFIFHISQMDTAYLKYRASKVESGK